MPAQIFQHAADEIAHVDQGDVRQAVGAVTLAGTPDERSTCHRL
jgi:hypothetical protein